MSLDGLLWAISQIAMMMAAVISLAALLAGAALLLWVLLGRPGWHGEEGE
jgi:hypothetical protein